MGTWLSRSAAPLERLSRMVTLATFAVAVFVAIAAPLLALSWRHQPFPGFLVEPTLVVNGYNYWPGGPAKPGYPERVVRVGDLPVVRTSELNAALSARQVGDTVSLLTKSPDGMAHVYPSVPLTAFPIRDMVRLFWLPYLVGLVYLGIAAWIYLAGGKSRPGRALAFFCLCTSAVSLLVFDLATTHTFSLIWTAAVAQLGGALISLALRFPVEWKPIQRRAWLLGLPYLVSLGLAGWAILAVSSAAHPWAYITAWGASYRYAALAILMFLGITLYRARAAESALVRRQARVVLLGSAIAFVPVGYWFIAPLLNLSTAFSTVLFFPGLVVFPLAVAVAIFRYRLSEADALVSRTIVYGALSAILGGAFTSLTIALQKLFVAFTGEKSDAAIVITTLIIASAFPPLKKRLELFVDARFRRQPESTQELRQFGDQVRAFTRMSEPEQITKRLLEEAASAFAAQSGAVSLAVGGSLQTVHSVGRWTGEAWLSLPLDCGGARYGMLFLGPPRDHQEYSRHDFEVLRHVSGEVARAIRMEMATRPLSAPLGNCPEQRPMPATDPMAGAG